MAKMGLTSIGRLLREKRGDRGIREVASEIGVSSATLSRVENGKLPDLETFSKICKWLNVDPGELLGCKGSADSSASLEQPMVSVHLRADKTQSPEVAQALAEMILAAQNMIPRRQG